MVTPTESPGRGRTIITHNEAVAQVTQALRDPKRIAVFEQVDNQGVPRSDLCHSIDVSYPVAAGYVDELETAGVIATGDAARNPDVSYTPVGWAARQRLDDYTETVADYRNEAQAPYRWMQDEPDASAVVATIFKRLDADHLAALDTLYNDEPVTELLGQVDDPEQYCRRLTELGLVTEETDRSNNVAYTYDGRSIISGVKTIGPDQAVEAFDVLRIEGRYELLTHIGAVDHLSDIAESVIDAHYQNIMQWKDRLVEAGLVEQEGRRRGATYHRTPEGGELIRMFDVFRSDEVAEVAGALQSRDRLTVFGHVDGSTVNEVVDQTGIGQQAVYRYIREMEDAGLIYRESSSTPEFVVAPLAEPTMRFLEAVNSKIGIGGLVDGLEIEYEREERGPIFLDGVEPDRKRVSKEDQYSGYDGGFGN